jgi:hypothetical protein
MLLERAGGDVDGLNVGELADAAPLASGRKTARGSSTSCMPSKLTN